MIVPNDRSVDDSKFDKRMFRVRHDATDNVRTITSAPYALSVDSALCVMGDSLYAVGIGPAYNELWKWNAASDWTRLADMTSGRRRHCVAVVGSKLYALGGIAMNSLAVTSGRCIL